MKETYSNILVEFFEKMSSWENSIVAERDISLPQVHLLEVVGNNEPIKMKALSEKLGVTTGTLTVMIHRLITKGFVQKSKNQDDKRSYFISLTDTGKDEYTYHHEMHDNLIEEIMDAVGENECSNFFQHLNTIQNLM